MTRLCVSRTQLECESQSASLRVRVFEYESRSASLGVRVSGCGLLTGPVNAQASESASLGVRVSKCESHDWACAEHTESPVGVRVSECESRSASLLTGPVDAQRAQLRCRYIPVNAQRDQLRAQRACCCATTKSRDGGSWTPIAAQGGGTAGLQRSYDRRGLQAVKPSARRGRGELRVSTPRHFGAAYVIATDSGISSGLH